MKTRNFPEKKNARRKRALEGKARVLDKLVVARIQSKSKVCSAEEITLARELTTLSERIVPSARGVMTKINRSNKAGAKFGF